jgi:hypothetical protein
MWFLDKDAAARLRAISNQHSAIPTCAETFTMSDSKKEKDALPVVR